jgi:hypothetical protein
VSRYLPPRSVCGAPCCLHPAPADSAFGARSFEATLRSLSLRPDDLLTILKMALSIDERFGFLSPSIQTARFLILPGGFASH